MCSERHARVCCVLGQAHLSRTGMQGRLQGTSCRFPSWQSADWPHDMKLFRSTCLWHWLQVEAHAQVVWREPGSFHMWGQADNRQQGKSGGGPLAINEAVGLR